MQRRPAPGGTCVVVELVQKGQAKGRFRWVTVAGSDEGWAMRGP